MSKSSRSTSRSKSRTASTKSRSSSRTRSESPASSSSLDVSDDPDDIFESGYWARARATRRKAAPATIASGAPWVKNGNDYGPARAAITDLAVWALDLAERQVSDDPADCKRIRNVRRAIVGSTTRAPSAGDVMFTAELLARVFDHDLNLDLADQLAIFEQLELSTDFLPLWSTAPRATTPLHGRTPTRLPTPTRAESPTCTVRIRLDAVPKVRIDARTPPPLRYCEECGRIHESGDHVQQYRNAA